MEVGVKAQQDERTVTAKAEPGQRQDLAVLFKWCVCVDQWNRTESPEINTNLYDQLIFDKGGRSIKWSKNNLVNKWCWEIWTATYKKMKLDHQLATNTKINSRWIKDLNISHDTIEVLEENTGRKISDIPCSNIFTDMSPKAGDVR